MNVFISSDIEGTAGVVSRSQLHGESAYKEACMLMTKEVNAAITGAIAEGAGKIVVCDSHWQMRNIDPEILHSAATLIQGDPRPLGMMQVFAVRRCANTRDLRYSLGQTMLRAFPTTACHTGARILC